MIQSKLNTKNILLIDRCVWRLSNTLYINKFLNASMWHIYQMCTETVRDAWVVCTGYSAVHWQWSRLASVSWLA